MFYPCMQQYVIFNVLKEYCIPKEEEEEEEDSNNFIKEQIATENLIW